MRIQIEVRRRQPDLLEDRAGPRFAFARSERGVHGERLAQRAANRPAWIERIAGILVAILQLRRGRALLARRSRTDVFALENDAAAIGAIDARERLAEC